MEQIKEITVHTEWKDITLNQLKEMYESRDIITDPDYQRKYVYNDCLLYTSPSPRDA